MRTWVLLLASVLASTFAVGAKGRLPGRSETVVVQSSSLKLRAQLWRPEGRGPFPAVLFNHGSGRGTKVVLTSSIAKGRPLHSDPCSPD